MILWVSACTTTGSDTILADASVEADDASVEADATASEPLDEALFGTWVGCDTPEREYLLQEDGEARYCVSASCIDSGTWDYVGTFTTSGGVMTMSLLSKEGVPVERYLTYHVGQDRFYRRSFVAQGEHTGMVGSWLSRNGYSEPEETRDIEIALTLRNDMSASGSYTDPTISGDLEGYWAKTEDQVAGLGRDYIAELTAPDALPLITFFDFVDGQVIAGAPLCRYSP